MKIFSIVGSLILVSSFSFAAELIGFSQKTSDDPYRVINAQGKEIFRMINTDVRRVSLRDGFAVVQDRFDYVSVIKEDGTVVVDGRMGKEFKATPKLIAIYNPDGVGAVYDFSGKVLFSSGAVQSMGVSENYFAVINSFNKMLTVYDATGAALWSDIDTESAILTNNYIGLFSKSGQFQLRTTAGEILDTDYNVKSVKLSDQFAGFIGSDGWLRVYSYSEGNRSIMNLAMIDEYGFRNRFFFTADEYGLRIFNNKGETLCNSAGFVDYKFDTNGVVLRYNTGMAMVYSKYSGKQAQLGGVEDYQVSNRMLMTRTSTNLYRIYSLDEDTFVQPFSKEAGELFSYDIHHVTLGVHSVAVKYKTQDRLRFFTSEKMVGEYQYVNRIDVTENGLNVNWGRF